MHTKQTGLTVVGGSERLPKAAVGFLPQPIYPDDTGLFLSVCCESVSSSSGDLHCNTTQTVGLTNSGKHAHIHTERGGTKASGYKSAET